jgi:hypothetical protein
MSVNGVYRVEIIDADLVANGITVRGDLLENHGLYTWKLMDGSWRFDARAEPAQRNPSDEGTYRIDHDRITFMFPAGDPPNLDLRYSLDGAMLTFSTVGRGREDHENAVHRKAMDQDRLTGLAVSSPRVVVSSDPQCRGGQAAARLAARLNGKGTQRRSVASSDQGRTRSTVGVSGATGIAASTVLADKSSVLAGGRAGKPGADKVHGIPRTESIVRS